MQINYKLDLPDDDGQYQLIVHSHDMLSALIRLQGFVRSVSKGYVDPTQLELLDELNDILIDSKVDEIP